MIGDGDRRLPELTGARDQPLDPAGAVEQAVFTVYMQVDERHDDLLSAHAFFTGYFRAFFAVLSSTALDKSTSK